MDTIWIYQFRLIVIGDSTVGKSCLLQRFTQGRFPGLRAPACDPTVGVDFFSRLLEIEPGKRIKLQLWDTAGQERFRTLLLNTPSLLVLDPQLFDSPFAFCPNSASQTRKRRPSHPSSSSPFPPLLKPLPRKRSGITASAFQEASNCLACASIPMLRNLSGHVVLSEGSRTPRCIILLDRNTPHLTLTSSNKISLISPDFILVLLFERGVKEQLVPSQLFVYFSFRSITRSYYRNSVGGFLVFDITNRRSFEHVKDWLEEAKMHVQPFRIVFLLVGHKCDLASQRQVTREEAEILSADCGMKYIETSAKDATNVEESFTILTREIYELIKRGEICIQDGWEGVKSGFVPNTVHSSEEAVKPRKECPC
ncbi:Ras-related protein Rab-39A [Galemys pyrenaicus]|uniref:Ras-related protein Rab-39A n=1 Tax=Galemys pyrenaicus TaxID=202257 RepID=A0A8J6BJ49_GALPY|nr:Ras-related protein Rab-39A [Galemys pyrenaicus]